MECSERHAGNRMAVKCQLRWNWIPSQGKMLLLRAALPRSFFFKINPLCINSCDLWRGGPQCRHGHMSQWIRRIYCIRAAGERSDEERVMTGCCRCLLAGGQRASASWDTNRRESTLCILMSRHIVQVRRLKKKKKKEERASVCVISSCWKVIAEEHVERYLWYGRRILKVWCKRKIDRGAVNKDALMSPQWMFPFSISSTCNIQKMCHAEPDATLTPSASIGAFKVMTQT